MKYWWRLTIKVVLLLLLLLVVDDVDDDECGGDNGMEFIDVFDSVFVGVTD